MVEPRKGEWWEVSATSPLSGYVSAQFFFLLEMSLFKNLCTWSAQKNTILSRQNKLETNTSVDANRETGLMVAIKIAFNSS